MNDYELYEKDPYNYIAYNKLSKYPQELFHKLMFKDICRTLRRFDRIECYSVSDWNDLFEFFCIPAEFEKFDSMEQVISCISDWI